MKKTPKWLALALGLSLFSGITAAAHADTSASSTWERIQQTKVLRLAGTNSELWAYKDNTHSDAPGAVKVGDTTWRGLGPVIAQALAEALGAKLEIVETTWGNAVPGLQSGQFDLIFGLDGTPTRAAAVDFIPQPLFWTGTALAARDSVDIRSWEAVDKAKVKIAVPAGTSQETEIAKRAPNAQLSKFQDFNDMVAAYQSGRVDALSASLTTVTIISARLPNSKVGIPTPGALFPTVGAVRKETDPRWSNFLQTSLQYYVNNGLIQKALDDAYRFRGVDVSNVPPAVIRR